MPLSVFMAASSFVGGVKPSVVLSPVKLGVLAKLAQGVLRVAPAAECGELDRAAHDCPNGARLGPTNRWSDQTRQRRIRNVYGRFPR
jgi:hypothetical protein